MSSILSLVLLYTVLYTDISPIITLQVMKNKTFNQKGVEKQNTECFTFFRKKTKNKTRNISAHLVNSPKETAHYDTYVIGTHADSGSHSKYYQSTVNTNYICVYIFCIVCFFFKKEKENSDIELKHKRGRALLFGSFLCQLMVSVQICSDLF